MTTSKFTAAQDLAPLRIDRFLIPMDALRSGRGDGTTVTSGCLAIRTGSLTDPVEWRYVSGARPSKGFRSNVKDVYAASDFGIALFLDEPAPGEVFLHVRRTSRSQIPGPGGKLLEWRGADGESFKVNPRLAMLVRGEGVEVEAAA